MRASLADGPAAARQEGTRTELQDGAQVVIRAIRDADAPALAAAYSKLSEESRRRRFFSAPPELSSAELRYLTSIDHSCHEALVAIPLGAPEIVGAARYICSPDRIQQAELAVAVIDAWQHRGLGHVLLESLAERARRNGIACFTAVVSAENTPVLSALASAGAVGRAHGSEIEYVLDLTRLPSTRGAA
jgi:GNAT superfamily N-acetyltransferase